MDDSDLIVTGCNKDKIKCKDCKWAKLMGSLNSSCVKYKRKPYEVYYESEDCPKYEKSEVTNDD
ncbi:MAG: hypothetical protein IKF82_01315 [Bacilli bacterium]|nr:hypothetical protein [Bacilli bacterium]